MSKLERVMRLLDAVGASKLILRARAQARAPVLSVLCYHSVGDIGPTYKFDPELIDASPEQFRAQLEVLDRYFSVVGVDDVIAALRGEPLPPNPVVITFDDGYRSCLDVVLPMLQEFGFPAVFFIATNYVQDRQLYWWDRIHYLVKHAANKQLEIEYPHPLTLDLERDSDAIGKLLQLVKTHKGLDLQRFLDGLGKAAGVTLDAELEAKLVDELIMTWDDVRTLRRAGMDIGSHTRSHRVLQTLDEEGLAYELKGSREVLEEVIGEPVRAIAYPVGYNVASDAKIRRALQDAGYDVGFTNASGVNYMWRSIDPLDVSRMAVDPKVSMAMFRGQLAVPPLAFRRKKGEHSQASAS